MKLTKADMKLIGYLYHHHREPLSRIAKDTGLSRQQVEYSLKKLKDSGLIRKFVTVFNHPIIGYRHTAILFVKLSKVGDRTTFFSYLDAFKCVISRVEYMGIYDCSITAVHKDENGFNSFLQEVIDEFGIRDYMVLRPTQTELYPLKFLNIKEDTGARYSYGGESEIGLDEKEISLLKALEKDARARVIDLARESGLSSELIVYKLRKYREEKLILGSRIQFDMNKLGYHFTLLSLSIERFRTGLKNKLASFARAYPHTNSLLISATKPNCMIQLFYKEQDVLIDCIRKIETILKDDVFILNIHPLREEEIVNTLPFF